jgi:hypothetical protein
LQFFTASDGARIAYRDEGLGVPLVLLHGLMAHGGFFREQDALADHFRLIRIDLRGHGASAKDGDRSNVEQIAADVAELAEALDLVTRSASAGRWRDRPLACRRLVPPPTASPARWVSHDRALNRDWDLGLSAGACAAKRRDPQISRLRSPLGRDPAQPDRERRPRVARLGGASRFALATIRATIAGAWTSLVRQTRTWLRGDPPPDLVVHGAKSGSMARTRPTILSLPCPTPGGPLRPLRPRAPSDSPNCSTAP